MSILDSALAPYLTILVIVAIMAGFARKLLVKVLITVVVMAFLFALFPVLFQKFGELVLQMSTFIR